MVITRKKFAQTFTLMASLIVLAGCGDGRTSETTSQDDAADGVAEKTESSESSEGDMKMETNEMAESEVAKETTSEAPVASTETAVSSEGSWAATSATLAGTAFPEAVTKSITLKISGEQYEVLVGGQSDKGTCTVDRDGIPNKMTITGAEGPNAGKTLLALCDFPDQDHMRVCYDMKGTTFPETFESTPENGCFLVIYERQK